VETCNAFDPVESRRAATFEAKDPHVYRDDANPPAGDVTVFEERDRVLEAVYGDSLRTLENPKGWIDKQRIHIEIEARLAKGQGDVAERMFLNRKLAQAGAAFNIEHFKELRRPGGILRERSIITVGVDGARHDDALAIMATDVKTGFQWPLDIIERPEMLATTTSTTRLALTGRWSRRWSVGSCGGSTSTRSTSSISWRSGRTGTARSASWSG
jgi:hypothetical protein